MNLWFFKSLITDRVMTVSQSRLSVSQRYKDRNSFSSSKKYLATVFSFIEKITYFPYSG
jgi:hypothetical protein